jgi:hypothetical protein
MYFQVIVAALVCLTATCGSLTAGYLPIPLLRLRATRSGSETSEKLMSYIGKGRDLFYLHTQGN